MPSPYPSERAFSGMERDLGRYVRPLGPKWARVAIIGESAGEVERQTGLPFQGPSGRLLDAWLSSVGLTRDEVYIDNIYPYYPPGGRISSVPEDEIHRLWLPKLKDRLGELSNLRAILSVGDVATRALLSLANISPPGIAAIRGSCYEVPLKGPERVWVVPTIHPAWYLRGQLSKQRRSVQDLNRAVLLSRIPYQPFSNVPSSLRIGPSQDYFSSWVEDTIRSGQPVAIDIETATSITSVAICRCLDEETIVYSWSDLPSAAFETLLSSSLEKIFHNGLYDCYWLSWYGLPVVNYRWDTLYLHHVLYADDEHSLDYIASTSLLYYRYWKDARRRSDNFRDLLRYNGQDAWYTARIFTALRDRLQAEGRLEFYLDFYQSFFKDLLFAMLHGVRVDRKTRERLKANAEERKAKILADLELEVGHSLLSKGGKDFSRKLLLEFFYSSIDRSSGERIYRKSVKRKTGKDRTVTLDASALTALAARASSKKRKVARLVLEYRHLTKEILEYGKEDSDGYIRCSYSMNTSTGRLSSSANPRGTGRNLQNVARGIARSTYLPDPGEVFLAIDGSQVEDRIVKLYTHSDRLIELARRHPLEWDAHTYNASRIFGIPESEVTKEQRDLGKRAVHAAQRGMKAETLQRALALLGYEKTIDECEALISAYLEDHWEIRDVYFPWVRSLVAAGRPLENSFGRKIVLAKGQDLSELFRQGYSFFPQSDCADWLHSRARTIANLYRTAGIPAKIVLFVHDEIVISVPPKWAWPAASVALSVLEEPVVIAGSTIRIWCELSLGSSWDCEYSWKELPSYQEFTSALETLVDKASAAEDPAQGSTSRKKQRRPMHT
jgi:uracil-DNA glycosylase family 4